jgi:hypothetical protein
MKYAFLVLGVLFLFLTWVTAPDPEDGIDHMCAFMSGVSFTLAGVIAWDDQRKKWENS